MRRDSEIEIEALDRALVEAKVEPSDSARTLADTQMRWAKMERRLGFDSHMKVQELPGVTVRRFAHIRSARAWPTRVWSVGIVGAALLLLSGISIHFQGERPVRAHVYATTTGQRLQLTLVDSTLVTLGPASRLVVPSAFGRHDRQVMLEGEAAFTVRPSPQLPYVVRTGNVTTRVLGTMFTIRRYSSDSVTRVAVLSGRVASVGKQRGVILSTHTVGYLTDSTATSLHVDDIQQYTAWQHGRLVFRETPLPQMLATLSRWYGYEFRVADTSLAGLVLTSEFRADALDETLWILADELHVSAHVDGKIITLRRRAHPGDSAARVHGELRGRDEERRALTSQSLEGGR